MTFIKRFMFAASVGIGTLLMGNPASASQIFNFSGVLDDGDRFDAVLTTENTLTSINALAHINELSGLISPAYTFQGYLITHISGNWFEFEDLTTPLKIVDLRPVGSIIENSPFNNPPGPDTRAHSPTDNLFNPNKGFIPSIGGIAGKFSYGGVEFVVANGREYQLFTDPAPGKPGYAGCPGSCVGVSEVPIPGTLPLMGAGLTFAWSRSIRRRIKAA